MKAIKYEFKAQGLAKAKTLLADAVANGVRPSDELRSWSRDVERKLHRQNRELLAIAVYKGTLDALVAPAALQKAWEVMADNAAEANRAVARVAAVADWMAFAPDTRPVVLWQGEAKTAVAASNLKELIVQLRTEPELVQQLAAQGKNVLTGQKLAPVAQWLVDEYPWVLQAHRESLIALGKYQKPEHTVALANGAKVNAYAWAQAEAVQGVKRGSAMAKGLADVAKFAAEQSVVHAHFGAIASFSFWVAQGVMPRKPKAGDPDEAPYSGGDELLIRAPFFKETNLGVSPSYEEAVSAVTAAMGDFESMGEQLKALAIELDARIGSPTNYYTAMGDGPLSLVFSATKARLEERDAEAKEKWEGVIQKRLRAKAENVLAQAQGLNAAERSSFIKAACDAIEGLKPAIAAYRDQAAHAATAQAASAAKKAEREASFASGITARHEEARREAQLAEANHAIWKERKEAAAAKRAVEARKEAELRAEMAAIRAKAVRP